jgi:hypothetical protein
VQAVQVLVLDQLKSEGSTLTSLHHTKGLTGTGTPPSDAQDEETLTPGTLWVLPICKLQGCTNLQQPARFSCGILCYTMQVSPTNPAAPQGGLGSCTCQEEGDASLM